MLEAVFAEFESHPPGPKLILGDINGDPQNFPVLQAALDAEDYVDIGNYPGVCVMCLRSQLAICSNTILTHDAILFLPMGQCCR